VTVDRVCSSSSNRSLSLWISLSRDARVWVKSSKRRETPRWPTRRFEMDSGAEGRDEAVAEVGTGLEAIAGCESEAEMGTG
jgi:hypothetical protein